MSPFINGICLCCHNYFKCQIFESKGPINEYGELMPIELLWGWMYERQWKDNYPRPQISTRLLACFVSSLTFTGCCFLFPHSCSFFRFLYHAYCSVYLVTQRSKFMGHATHIESIHVPTSLIILYVAPITWRVKNYVVFGLQLQVLQWANLKSICNPWSKWSRNL